MKENLQLYYDYALNKTTFNDEYMQGMWNTAMLAVREMGDEILRLEREIEDYDKTVMHLFGIVEEDDEYYYIDDLIHIETLKFSSFYVRWPKSKGLDCVQEEIANSLKENNRWMDDWYWIVTDFQWIGEKVHGVVTTLAKKEPEQ